MYTMLRHRYVHCAADFQCPDTKAAWNGVLHSLRQKHYNNVSIIFHPFPLPYHKCGPSSSNGSVIFFLI